MSIASTVASLERANAAYKAAQAAATPVAKRGMFALVEREHRYSYLYGAYSGYVSYTPAVVSSVTRDGIVKEVRLVGQGWPLKRRDWQQITVDSAGKVADPARVCATLIDERGFAVEYRDQAEAVPRHQGCGWLVLITPPKSASEIGGIAGLGSAGFGCPTTTSFKDENNVPHDRTVATLN